MSPSVTMGSPLLVQWTCSVSMKMLYRKGLTKCHNKLGKSSPLRQTRNGWNTTRGWKLLENEEENGVVLGNHQVIVKKGRYKKMCEASMIIVHTWVWSEEDTFSKVHWKNSLKCRFEIWAKLAQSTRSFLLKPNEQNFFLGGIRIKAENAMRREGTKICVWSCGVQNLSRTRYKILKVLWCFCCWTIVS